MTIVNYEILNTEIQLAHTWGIQVEILPRFTIVYGDGFALEWLWISLSIFKKDSK